MRRRRVGHVDGVFEGRDRGSGGAGPDDDDDDSGGSGSAAGRGSSEATVVPREESRTLIESEEVLRRRAAIMGGGGAAGYLGWLRLRLLDLIRQLFGVLFGFPFLSALFGRAKSASGGLGNVNANAIDDPVVRERLEAFKRRVTTPYDASNTAHEEELTKLWSICFPGEPLERRTKKWGRVGFQGVDPATDFRGGGVFALRNLIFFAERYPRKFHFLLDTPHLPSDRRYPFAITGLNLTNMLFETIGLGMRPSTRPHRDYVRILLGADAAASAAVDNHTAAHVDAAAATSNSVAAVRLVEHAFEELYCLAFHIFDEEWESMRASYMDFPRVLASTRVRLDTVVAPMQSKDDVRRLNRQNDDAGVIELRMSRLRAEADWLAASDANAREPMEEEEEAREPSPSPFSTPKHKGNAGDLDEEDDEDGKKNDGKEGEKGKEEEEVEEKRGSEEKGKAKVVDVLAGTRGGGGGAGAGAALRRPATAFVGSLNDLN